MIAAVAKLAMTATVGIGEEYSAVDKTPQNQNSKNAEIESATIAEPLIVLSAKIRRTISVYHNPEVIYDNASRIGRQPFTCYAPS